jgi:DNA-binding NtrC family response regulator
MLPTARPVVEVTPVPVTVEEMEKNLILQTLAELGGNRTHAARKLGISLRTLRNKLREYRESGTLIEPGGVKNLPSVNSVPAERI